jgi:two-component system, sensor histidine kinase
MGNLPSKPDGESPMLSRPARSTVGRALAALRRPRHSLSGRVMSVVLLTTALALVIAGAGLLLTDLRGSRQAWAEDIATQADILVLSVAPALSFEDRAAASRSLNALQAKPSVAVAAVYSPTGDLYTYYARSVDALPSKRLPELSEGVHVRGDRVELLRPVVQSSETLGTIYLQARYDITQRIKAYAGILVAVMILSLALALLASSQLQRLITGPIASIANVARQVVGRRDYSLRATKATDDDLGVLVQAFNEMLDEVQLTQQALLDADRRKDEFLATLAHELRNPLAPIRNAVRILEMPATDEQQRRWGREVISRQVRNMALLLDDLLDVSRITRGKLELKKEYVSLRNMIDGAVETARPLIEGRRHNFVVKLPAPDVTLEVDPLRMSQVVANLLTNAAKYTDTGGHIALTASISTAGLLIAVKDSGIGLAPQTIPGLFAMFSQVNTAIDRTQGGLGIGLGLVKGLVNLHGGTVEARSGGLGQGSEFIVHLPPSVIGSQTSRQESTGGPIEIVSPRTPARILVADDNREAAESLAALLQLSGYRTSLAFDGPQALELAAQERPDVFLLDVGMPGMSGYEVARRIRLEAWGRDALLIAITGWGQQDDKLQAKAAGFNAHLTKPVDPRVIERMLVEFFSSATRNAVSSSWPAT